MKKMLSLLAIGILASSQISAMTLSVSANLENNTTNLSGNIDSFSGITYPATAAAPATTGLQLAAGEALLEHAGNDNDTVALTMANFVGLGVAGTTISTVSVADIWTVQNQFIRFNMMAAFDVSDAMSAAVGVDTAVPMNQSRSASHDTLDTKPASLNYSGYLQLRRLFDNDAHIAFTGGYRFDTLTLSSAVNTGIFYRSATVNESEITTSSPFFALDMSFSIADHFDLTVGYTQTLSVSHDSLKTSANSANFDAIRLRNGTGQPGVNGGAIQPTGNFELGDIIDQLTTDSQSITVGVGYKYDINGNS